MFCLWYQCGDAPCSSHTGSNHHNITAGADQFWSNVYRRLFSIFMSIICLVCLTFILWRRLSWALIGQFFCLISSAGKIRVMNPTTTEPHLTLQLNDDGLTCGCSWSAARSNDWSWSQDQRHLEELRRRRRRRRRSWETAGQTEHIIMTNRKDWRQNCHQILRSKPCSPAGCPPFCRWSSAVHLKHWHEQH